MNKQDIIEKLIISGIMVGIFLPIRLFFSEFFSDHWLGSLGIVSLLAFLLFVLIKKNKLGKFGKMFERQIIKTMQGKTGKIAIVLSVVFLVYFATTLLLIDRGNTVHFQDKELFYDEIIKNKSYTIENISKENLNGPIYVSGSVLQVMSVLDYGLSISYAVANDITEGWLGHIVVVLLAEQIEVTGLLLFYKKMYISVKRNEQILSN